MGLAAADIATIATAVEVTVGSSGIIPEESTITEQVTIVGARLLSEMQTALRARYGALPSPLPDDLRELLLTGVMAELYMLGFANLSDDEKAWPDEWRRRFDNGLAALASGIDTLDTADVASTTQPTAAASNTRIFTASGFDALL